ncbi:hypothetical protein AcW1_000661 [Taiwanofungus camphoratus]|nr:hypothetical protein AcV5_004559 [Antrodia cinnamomea]KAI0963638.1 hypothetical protein AcW1_000661 [Antrodia cinnamomea]
MAAEIPLPNDLLRVVTGHNDAGLAVIRSEDCITSEGSAAFPNVGLRTGAVWTTDSMPSNDNNSVVDGATRIPQGDMGIVMHGGTNLRYTDLAPGVSAPMHRTSSLDYNILIHGRLILVLEDGVERVFQTPGDVVIQRGTIHAWKNPGPDWTRWVTIVVDAKPAIVNGTVLGMETRE